MSIFAEIKNRITMPDVITAYGIEMNSAKMCHCPFHTDKTASAKIYNDSFHCFGCGIHEDVIGFVQRYFNITKPIDAAKKLNEDFCLGLDLSKPPDSHEILKIREQQKNVERYKKWEEEAWQILRLYFGTMLEWEKYSPISPGEEPIDRYLYALQNKEYAEYLCEEFRNSDKEGRWTMGPILKEILNFLRNNL